MRIFKKGDKVTIRKKDIHAIFKADFPAGERGYRIPVMTSLKYLMKNGGIITTVNTTVRTNVNVDISTYTAWNISTKFLYLYNDMSLPEDLFKI
jgi:hypothetical protein